MDYASERILSVNVRFRGRNSGFKIEFPEIKLSTWRKCVSETQLRVFDQKRKPRKPQPLHSPRPANSLKESNLPSTLIETKFPSTFTQFIFLLTPSLWYFSLSSHQFENKRSCLEWQLQTGHDNRGWTNALKCSDALWYPMGIRKPYERKTRRGVVLSPSNSCHDINETDWIIPTLKINISWQRNKTRKNLGISLPFFVTIKYPTAADRSNFPYLWKKSRNSRHEHVAPPWWHHWGPWTIIEYVDQTKMCVYVCDHEGGMANTPNRVEEWQGDEEEYYRWYDADEGCDFIPLHLSRSPW